MNNGRWCFEVCLALKDDEPWRRRNLLYLRDQDLSRLVEKRKKRAGDTGPLRYYEMLPGLRSGVRSAVRMLTRIRNADDSRRAHEDAASRSDLGRRHAGRAGATIAEMRSVEVDRVTALGEHGDDHPVLARTA